MRGKSEERREDILIENWREKRERWEYVSEREGVRGERVEKRWQRRARREEKVYKREVKRKK
jgi:hypothetical protein